MVSIQHVKSLRKQARESSGVQYTPGIQARNRLGLERGRCFKIAFRLT